MTFPRIYVNLHIYNFEKFSSINLTGVQPREEHVKSIPQEQLLFVGPVEINMNVYIQCIEKSKLRKILQLNICTVQNML